MSIFATDVGTVLLARIIGLTILKVAIYPNCSVFFGKGIVGVSGSR